MCCAFSSNSLALVFGFVLSFHQSIPTILPDMQESVEKQVLFAGKSIDILGLLDFHLSACTNSCGSYCYLSSHCFYIG